MKIKKIRKKKTSHGILMKREKHNKLKGRKKNLEEEERRKK